MHKVIQLSMIAAALTAGSSAVANGLGENTAWQFQTTGELANRAYIEDLRRKQQSGFYNSPVYNSFIDNQNNFNCSNSANASGNAGTNTTTANTPNSVGATGSAVPANAAYQGANIGGNTTGYISCQSSAESRPARRSSQYFQASEPEPSTWPRQLPRSMGPAGR